jgi:hypothetical protein
MPGGCLLIAAAVEFDDRPGPQRDYLAAAHRKRSQFLAKAARMAVEAGHFRSDLDCEQLAFEINATILGYHYAHRMLREESAIERARAAFARLLADATGDSR